MTQTIPLTTGKVARLLNSTEPRVAELVRRGRIHPEPEIASGRRLWSCDQVLQAAAALGGLDASTRERIEQAFGLASPSPLHAPSATRSIAAEGLR